VPFSHFSHFAPALSSALAVLVKLADDSIESALLIGIEEDPDLAAGLY
jgi:hypothetical protein